MLGQTHVIYVCFVRLGIGQLNGIIPETEIINAAFTFCDCEEGLSVTSLNSCDEADLSVHLDSTGVHYSVYSETLHKVGICFGVQVISPKNRSMLCCKNRIFIAVINTVVIVGFFVFAGKQNFLLCKLACIFFLKSHVIYPFGKITLN